MRSPCLSCDRRDLDKNDAECIRCIARLEYVTGIGKCPSASIELEVRPAAVGGSSPSAALGLRFEVGGKKIGGKHGHESTQ
jgi:hypothetical protein